MINTRDYFGRPLYLASTPTPYQGFAPIGEYQRRQNKSPFASLDELFQPSSNPFQSGNGSGQGTGTGDGTGSGVDTGSGTGGGEGTNTGGSTGGGTTQNGQTGSNQSEMDIALGTYRYGQNPNGNTDSDTPYGYPDWQTARRAYEWEIANGGTVLDKSPDNPDQPDYQRYPGSSGDQQGGSSGGSTAGGGGGGSTGNPTDLPQFGIGGAIDNYPGVWSPNAPTQSKPGGYDILNGAGTIYDILSGVPLDPTLFPGLRGLLGGSDVVSGANNLVSGPGQAPPVGGEFAAGLDNVLGTVGTVLNAKTLLDGDADPINKITAGMSLAAPPIGAMMAATNLIGNLSGVSRESAAAKGRSGEAVWGAVNDAFLDALGRDAGPSRNFDYYAPGIHATNVDDLNFLNSFLASKDLLADPEGDKLAGLYGRRVDNMYGQDVQSLWDDLVGYYSSYENAPAMGDVPNWGELADTRINDYISGAGGALNAFGPLQNGEFGHGWSPGIAELLAGVGGDPTQNPNYNPYFNDNFLSEYQYGLAYGPDDPWGLISGARNTERGGW